MPGFSLSQVTRVLLTHVHADHSGMAGMLQREAGAKVGMHELDARQFTSRFTRTGRPDRGDPCLGDRGRRA